MSVIIQRLNLKAAAFDQWELVLRLAHDAVTSVGSVVQREILMSLLRDEMSVYMGMQHELENLTSSLSLEAAAAAASQPQPVL